MLAIIAHISLTQHAAHHSADAMRALSPVHRLVGSAPTTCRPKAEQVCSTSIRFVVWFHLVKCVGHIFSPMLRFENDVWPRIK